VFGVVFGVVFARFSGMGGCWESSWRGCFQQCAQIPDRICSCEIRVVLPRCISDGVDRGVPVMVHCKHGIHRTGAVLSVAIALERARRRAGWTLDQADWQEALWLAWCCFRDTRLLQTPALHRESWGATGDRFRMRNANGSNRSDA
jgi:hypothetical protein